MPTEIIEVDRDHAVLALGRLGAGIRQNEELMRIIGISQLASIRRTFRDSGSPAHSWAPLAQSTIRSNPKKYGPGHKLLIDRGILINSITFVPHVGFVIIGTNVPYARVLQDGSADRRGAAIGPQARIAGRSVRVGRHSYRRLREIHYRARKLHDAQGNERGHIPEPMRTGRRVITNSRGHKTTVNARYQGPRQQIEGDVSEHERFQNIPPRPYIVFRPEDPARLRALVVEYIEREKLNAGLAGPGGA
jgi:phage gpG-like protein